MVKYVGKDQPKKDSYADYPIVLQTALSADNTSPIYMSHCTFTISHVAFVDTQSAACELIEGKKTAENYGAACFLSKHTTKGSPSGEEGKADSEAAGHVALVT